MVYLSDTVLDAALQVLVSNADRIDITVGEANTYAKATTGGDLSCGYGVTSCGTIGDRTPNGRKTAVAAVSGASVTNSGTVTHWALTNGTDTLYATNSLAAQQAVVATNTFDLTTFDIGIPDGVSA